MQGRGMENKLKNEVNDPLLHNFIFNCFQLQHSSVLIYFYLTLRLQYSI